VPNPVQETSAITAEWVWSVLQPASDRVPRYYETQTELAHANGVAMSEQLSASIAEINQPISAIVMNAEAALQLLLARPTDIEAVQRLLACIVKDAMRTGDIVNRTRGLIKESAAGGHGQRTLS
jgi:C4-dicarboxylate-specific signal transduction histidine kinase